MKDEIATILGDFSGDEDRRGERLTLCWSDNPADYEDMGIDQGAIWTESEYGVFEDALENTAETLASACEDIETLYGHSPEWDLEWLIDPREAYRETE